jgi:hypothetical protein
MKAKLKVTFEPSSVKTSEVERRLEFIKDLPIRVLSHNAHNIDELEMEALFRKDKVVCINPIASEHVFYDDLSYIKNCNINANSTCINVTNLRDQGDETYSFFYKKKE